MFELSTNISNLKQLRQADWSTYDALYLGDFSCPEYPNNFMSHPELLREGVQTVKAERKKCYLRLYAVPSNHDLPWVTDVIEEAMTLPFDAFEVHNMGLLRLLKEMDCTIPIHTGIFANLYTHETAKILKGYGVERVYPNPELSLKEIVYIQENANIETLVPIHGKIPLVISETCFLVEFTDANPHDCKFLCSKDYWLKRGDWTLKDVGRMTLGGKDLCMIEHVDELLRLGLKNFYVQSRGESPEYVGAVGKIYREALAKAASGEKLDDVSSRLEELRSLAPIGLCNGYYFEGAGQKYVGRTPEWSHC